MFRPMRRCNQELAAADCREILQHGSCGVLAVLGDEDYPYAVPLNYVYDRAGERLLFHCATSGHKLDAIRRCDKASFCVVGQDMVVAEEYTSYFRSVIAFGRIRVLEQPEEILAAIELLAVKYAPEDSPEQRRRVIDSALPRLCMLELRLEHLSGKQARELLPQT